MSSAHALIDGDGGAPVGPLSVKDIERLVASLPAELRATIAWAPLELRAAVEAVRSDEGMSNEQLGRAAERIVGLMTPVIGPVMSWLGKDHRLSEVFTLWSKELMLLKEVLPDAGSRHAAEWTFRAFDAFFKVLAPMAGKANLAELAGVVGSQGLPSEAFTSEAGGFFRAQALLMAAIAEAEGGARPDVTAQLIDRAFLEIAKMVDLMGRVGIKIDPYAEEASEERAERILAYAQDVRDTLSPEDVERTVSAGRLRDLR